MKTLGPLLLFLWAAAPVFSQGFPLFDQQQATGVGVLDPERLFNESSFGQTFIKQFDEMASALNDENREIEAALEAEELELTRLRATEDPDVFAELAKQFDEKANRIRAERRQKVQDIVDFRAEAQQTFLQQVGPVLIQLMRENQISVIIDRDNVVLSLSNLDLTDQAIERIDQAFAQ